MDWLINQEKSEKLVKSELNEREEGKKLRETIVQLQSSVQEYESRMQVNRQGCIFSEEKNSFPSPSFLKKIASRKFICLRGNKNLGFFR